MKSHAIAHPNFRRGALVLLGIAMIAIGLTLLLSRADLALSHLFVAPGSSPDLNASFFPALVLAVDRAAQAWVFDRSALVSCARGMLLSCWPVVLVLLGAVLLQDWRFEGESTRNGINSQASLSGRGDKNR
jgi:hypothetical protein